MRNRLGQRLIDRIFRQLSDVILEALDGRKFDPVSPEWQAWLDRQQSSPGTL